ncbi:MAG: hypothetical protein OEW19_08785, partial [Acidobacteriota bacterium]|nr:hypothetical protein [Acidobacteriota bacterium]
ADGSGETAFLTRGPFAQAFSWTPDGRSLLASTGVAEDIVRVDLLHPTERTAILATDAGESEPMLSPDGAWLAYVSNESGRREVYVRPFPDVTKGRWVVSNDGGTSPRWRADGRELFYRSGDRMMAVTFGGGSPPALGDPAVLFEGRFADYVFGRYYDVTPDGQRFLMIAYATQGEADSYSIIIMEHWFEELRRKLPVP